MCVYLCVILNNSEILVKGTRRIKTTLKKRVERFVLLDILIF